MDYKYTNKNRGPRPGVGQLCSTPAVVTSVTEDSTRSWICNIGGCTKSFKTAAGRSVHISRMHMEFSNEQKAIVKVEATFTPRIRWREEESKLLAKCEARLLLDRPDWCRKDLVVALQQQFHRRSIAGIDRQRLKESHTLLVKFYLQDLVKVSPRAAKPGECVQQGTPDPSVTDRFVSLEKLIINVESPVNKCLLGYINRIKRGETVGAIELSTWLVRLLNPGKGQWKRRNHDGLGENSGGSTSVPGNPKKDYNHKVKKKEGYARTQRLWNSAKRNVIVRETLDNSSTASSTNLPSNMEQGRVIQYWTDVIQTPSTMMSSDRAHITPRSYDLEGIWAPITVKEVEQTELKRNSACGIDGISVDNWRKLPVEGRTIIFNLIQLSGGFSEEFNLGKTILIPKVTNPTDPSQLRPLTIESVVVRHFNKIIGARITASHNWDERLRAFLPVDGTCESITLVNTIFQQALKEKRECHAAYLDLSKAFDSVEHCAILESLELSGAPKAFMEYMKRTYDSQKTVLQYGDSKVLLVCDRGVRQGDPMSPIVFNLVLQYCLLKVDPEIGFRMVDKDGSSNVNLLCYADDTIFFASTEVGMERGLQVFTEALAEVGLSLNPDKCKVLSIKKDGKNKKMFIASKEAVSKLPWVTANHKPISLGEHSLKHLSVEEHWRYLGVDFIGPRLANMEFRMEEFRGCIHRISRNTYLKPSQKLDLFKTYLLPRVMHELCLGHFDVKFLSKLDKLIRVHIRKWLHLRTDVPISFLYTSENAGGLGMTCLATRVPILRLERLTKMRDSDNPQTVKVMSTFIMKRHLQTLEKGIAEFGDHNAKTRAQGEKLEWSRRLHSSWDGCGLVDAHKCKGSTNWLKASSTLLKGSDFIGVLKIRSDSLPTRARTSRGYLNAHKKACRNRCFSKDTGRAIPETNQHVIQVCGRTHGGRIKRHDAISRSIAQALGGKHKWTVFEEPQVTTAIKNCKPDLVLIKENVVIVLDVHVVGHSNIGYKHAKKASKYKSIPTFDEELRKLLREKYNSPIYDGIAITHLAATISSKGVWYEPSVRELKTFFKFGDRFFGHLARLAAVGSLRNYQYFTLQ